MAKLTTLFDIPEDVEVVGTVSSASVRSRGLLPRLMADLKSGTIGGRLGAYSKLLQQIQDEITSDLERQAAKMGADAIVGVRFIPYALESGDIGVGAIATAVKFRRKSGGKKADAHGRELIELLDEEARGMASAISQKRRRAREAASAAVLSKVAADGELVYTLAKLAGKSFLEKDYPAKAKEIYKALKRDHPNMPAEVKARIALRKSKKSKRSRKPPETGGPKYKAPIRYVRRKGRYVKKKSQFDPLLGMGADPYTMLRLQARAEEERRRRRREMLTKALILLAAAGAGAGGYHLFQKWRNRAPEAPKPKKPSMNEIIDRVVEEELS